MVTGLTQPMMEASEPILEGSSVDKYAEYRGSTMGSGTQSYTSAKVGPSDSSSQSCRCTVHEVEQRKAWEAADSTTEILHTENYGCLTNLVRNHVHHKLTYVLSVLTVLGICLCVNNDMSLIPYYYAISTPVLLTIRFIMYWKYKWQFFLIDFCYFANLYLYVFMWAAPNHPEASIVVFALANGPLIVAVTMFRNSMVFHDVDRMTSCYIHMLPAIITFGMRWYPEEMSGLWYTSFNDMYSLDLSYLAIWLIAVPFGAFVIHTLFYLLFVFVICRPGDKYWSSYRYMTEKKPDTWQGKILAKFGQEYAVVLYLTVNWLFCIVALLPVLLVYYYRIAHACYIGIFLIVILANGASYYTDVFAKQGFTLNNS